MIKVAVGLLVGGIAFWAIERYAISADGKFVGLTFDVDADGKPKLGLGYIALGGAIVLGAVGVGMLTHKLTGGRVPAGVALSH